MTKKDLYIVGAGGLGREVAAMVNHCSLLSMLYRVRAFVDDRVSASVVDGIPVENDIDKTLSELPTETCCALAIGDSRVRKDVFERIKNESLRWPNLIHSSVRVLDPNSIEKGQGVILAAGTTLTTGIRVGDFVFINLHCTVGHDVQLDAFTSVMPGAHLSGGVVCGESSYIGSGAVLLNNVKIGPKSVVGAGAVVRNDVAPETKVAGVPATEI